MPNDVVVVGGGIMGCGVAWRLAQQGMAVTVVERRQPGAEASSAAAGLIAPSAGRDGGPALLALWQESHRRYPAFVEEVTAATGIAPEFRSPGRLQIAFNDQEYADLLRLQHVQEAGNVSTERWSAERLRTEEPAISTEAKGALYFPGHSLVDNALLTQAIAMAAARTGVRFVVGHSVIGLLGSGDRISGVQTETERISAGLVVNAAGAWAGQIDPRFPIPVTASKGQILALETRPPLIRHLLSVPGFTIAARSTGRMVVGATVEDAGFDKRNTAGGIRELLEAAAKALPSTASAPVLETWAGLRPRSSDFLPILGQVTEGLYVVAGHFMTGIMAAPATIDAMAELITSGRSLIPLDAFAPGRFRSQ